jgi:hypothetical protein
MKLKLEPIRITNINSITLSVKIVITKRFKIRRIIGLALMKLAVQIVPCTVNLEIENKE